MKKDLLNYRVPDAAPTESTSCKSPQDQLKPWELKPALGPVRSGDMERGDEKEGQEHIGETAHAESLPSRQPCAMPLVLRNSCNPHTTPSYWNQHPLPSLRSPTLLARD